MAGYGKGRSTGYTDYYKNRSRTPGTDDSDEMSETIIPRTGTKPKSDVPTNAEERKAAIKRRLMKKKVGK